MKVTKSVVVGAFLIGGVVLFGAGLFMIGSQNNLFSHTFKAYAYFSNVNGLSSGAKVHVSGLDAGSVSGIEIPKSSSEPFRLTLDIDQKFRPLVRRNSVATITSAGMVGDQFIEIDPGEGVGPECSDGCTIRSKQPVTLSKLLDEGQGVMQTIKTTLNSADRVADHANQALTTFDEQARNGETGPQGVRATVMDAQRAANNVAEDAEALKHNFFLRGFFKRRGFYNLGQMSAEQYRKSDFVKEKKSRRVWLTADRLFARVDGREELTEDGRRELDQAMSDFVQYLPNKPLMVEGYADHGTPSAEYRESEERAMLVRDYLMNRYQLKSENTGAMPLSDSPPEKSGKTNWDGVSLVILT